MAKKDDQALRNTFQRIFALPITKSTIREVQGALLTHAEGDSVKAGAMFDSLLVGESKNNDSFKSLIDDFAVQVRVARDVFERGDFLNHVFSEIVNQNNRAFLMHFLQRVDGEEFRFFTDVEGTILLLKHMLNRIKDIQTVDFFKADFEANKPSLKQLADQLKELTS